MLDWYLHVKSRYDKSWQIDINLAEDRLPRNERQESMRKLNKLIFVFIGHKFPMTTPSVKTRGLQADIVRSAPILNRTTCFSRLFSPPSASITTLWEGWGFLAGFLWWGCEGKRVFSLLYSLILPCLANCIALRLVVHGKLMFHWGWYRYGSVVTFRMVADVVAFRMISHTWQWSS